MTITNQFLQCLACEKGEKETGRKIKEKGEAQCSDHQWSDKLRVANERKEKNSLEKFHRISCCTGTNTYRSWSLAASGKIDKDGDNTGKLNQSFIISTKVHFRLQYTPF